MDGDGEATWRNLSADNELCGLAVKAGSSVGPLGLAGRVRSPRERGGVMCHLRLPGLLLYVPTHVAKNRWSWSLFRGFYSDAEVLVKPAAGVRDAHVTRTRLSCLSTSACAFLLTVVQLLSTRLSLLPSAATCASYNFSFLSPQGLNFSSSQSSAPFWSGTLFFSFCHHLHMQPLYFSPLFPLCDDEVVLFLSPLICRA